MIHLRYASSTPADDGFPTENVLALAFIILVALVFVARLYARDSANLAAAQKLATRHPNRAHELYADLINEFNMTAMAHGQPAYWVADENRYTAGDVAWVRAWDMAGEQLADWDYEEKWNQEHGRLLYNGALKSGRWHKYHFKG